MPRTLFCFERLLEMMSGIFDLLLGRRGANAGYNPSSFSDERKKLRIE
jgi:hypothetical protein